MAKKSFMLNQEHCILFGVLVIILLGLYLVYLKMQPKKLMVENFYQAATPPACNSIRAIKTGYTPVTTFDLDVLYIYSTTRHLSSCSDAIKELKNDPNSSKNTPIAGIPKYPENYSPTGGFSATYLDPSGSLTPKSPSGLLFDYIATTLTSPDGIKYYTTDAAGEKIDPLKDQPYGHIYGQDKGNITTIIPDPTKLLTIMKEYFKALISIDNNTSVVFIKYYYKDSASKYCDGRFHFDQIPDCDLLAQMKVNNVIVFIENINIIRFLQLHNKPLYEQYQEYSKTFMANFKDASNNAK